MKQIEIRWPTVALVAAVAAGIVAVFAFAGPAERSDLLGILAVLGTAGAAVMRAAFGAQPAPAPKRIDDDSDANGGVVEGGVLDNGPSMRPVRTSVRRNTLLAVPTGLALALIVGCSPSALQTHATIALVASHTLEVTRASALATCTALRDACAADIACIEHTRADCLAVADAQDATVAAVAVYVDAVELAALADEGRVMEALRFTLEAVERAWVSFGERLAVVGISLPALGGVQ